MTPIVLIPGVGLGGWAFDELRVRLGDVPNRVLDRPDAPMDVVATDIRPDAELNEIESHDVLSTPFGRAGHERAVNIQQR